MVVGAISSYCHSLYRNGACDLWNLDPWNITRVQRQVLSDKKLYSSSATTRTSIAIDLGGTILDTIGSDN